VCPETLAVTHGSSYSGNCERLLRELATVIKETLMRAIRVASLGGTTTSFLETTAGCGPLEALTTVRQEIL
jgi:hypothetical protein